MASCLLSSPRIHSPPDSLMRRTSVTKVSGNRVFQQAAKEQSEGTKSIAEAAKSQATTTNGQLTVFRSTERAYVSVKGIELRDAQTNLPIGIFSVSNQGHPPATKMRHQLQMALCRYPLPPNAEFSD